MATSQPAPAGDTLRSLREDVTNLMRDLHHAKSALVEEKQRTESEQRKLFLAMLNVMDNFERVFGSIEPKLEAAERQAKNWANSFRSVYKLLSRELGDQGIVRIDSPDGKATPGFHNVVETREDLTLESGTIVEVWKQGYMWKDQVLRMADVVAVKN
ncbi:MAG TPA: nucleotide exchange factor GrpE [Bryobacteraceae bacterium]|nr:nucleotide exchange factor GrpE [Bryobacteraceae bacterium]